LGYDEPTNIGIVGFYHPGHDEPCDKLCGAPFLGNFWDLGADNLWLNAPNYEGEVYFSNAESAFQALKFWTFAEQFSPLSGDGAFDLKKSLRGKEDFSYGGYGSNWEAMFEVLREKFADKAMEDGLLQTGDAFLLEHNSVEGRDKVWSDNCKGDGSNWLGLQLMIIRDEIRNDAASQDNDWTNYIEQRIDLTTGNPRSDAGKKEWQATIQKACASLLNTLTSSAPGSPSCLLAGCGKPTWNGRSNEYCSNSHRQQAQSSTQGAQRQAAETRTAM